MQFLFFLFHSNSEILSQTAAGYGQMEKSQLPSTLVQVIIHLFNYLFIFFISKKRYIIVHRYKVFSCNRIVFVVIFIRGFFVRWINERKGPGSYAGNLFFHTRQWYAVCPVCSQNTGERLRCFHISCLVSVTVFDLTSQYINKYSGFFLVRSKVLLT